MSECQPVYNVRPNLVTEDLKTQINNWIDDSGNLAALYLSGTDDVTQIGMVETLIQFCLHQHRLLMEMSRERDEVTIAFQSFTKSRVTENAITDWKTMAVKLGDVIRKGGIGYHGCSCVGCKAPRDILQQLDDMLQSDIET